MKRAHGDYIPDREQVIADLLEGVPKLAPFARGAEVLGVSTVTLRRWVHQQRLVVVRSSPGPNPGRVFVPKVELERLLRTMLR